METGSTEIFKALVWLLYRDNDAKNQCINGHWLWPAD